MVLKVVGSTPISRPIIIYIGVSPSGKALDFDSSIRRFESCHPSQKRTHKAYLLPVIRLAKIKYGSLAQAVEHMTFNHVVRGSSPR